METERITYNGWPNCWRLTNGLIELIVTGDVGPRIIRCGFIGRENLFYEDAAALGSVGGDNWRIYGGHRLWHAPESMPRTYQPDNTGIGISLINGGLRAAQRVETATGIAKEIEVVLDQGRPRAIVVHRLRNCGLWPVELSPWALTAMAPGGAAVLPLPLARRHEDQLTPTHAIVLWAYSDMSDPRWTWGPQHVILRQDPACSAPQKTGVRGGPGWIAYVANGVLFLKTVTVHRGASYADLGCAIESFTNSEMLEIETLGPTVVLLPGGVVEHTETWILQANVRLPVGDPDITRDILPLISS